MSPRKRSVGAITFAVLAAAVMASQELLGRHLLAPTGCTDLSINADRLTNSTQAALEAIAAEFANVSDRYARDFDAHTALQGPTPFQIPGSPVKSPCDFSTKAQECSGIVDRETHPFVSPAGAPAANLNTYLPLSLSQPDSIMLLHPHTGACATMKEGNWSSFSNVTLSECLFQPTEPSLPQPQYWRPSNCSISNIVGPLQPGYKWTSDATEGAIVYGALPSGMPSDERWMVVPLPAPISFCASADQAALPSCRPAPYPVMVIREPAAPDQAVLCAAALEGDAKSGNIGTAVATGALAAPDASRNASVTMQPCHSSHAGQIWQVMDISGKPIDLTAGSSDCALPTHPTPGPYTMIGG